MQITTSSVCHNWKESLFNYAAFLAITITFGPIIKYPSNVQNNINTSIKITGNGLIPPPPLHYILNRAILLYQPQKQ